MSPAAMALREMVRGLLDRNGRFSAGGGVSSNVLLRCARHAAMSNAAQTLAIARNMWPQIQNATGGRGAGGG